DTPREVAVADGAEADADAGGGFSIVAIILVGGGVIFLIWLWRKQKGGRPARSGGGGGSMGSLKTAGNILRQKISGETYTPSLFRV
ncbi:hypothetical protein NL391_27725, partial [Klebsiella pneumoniae]|nr:hypothetical protein [Klebsiella pneumoniae]